MPKESDVYAAKALFPKLERKGRLLPCSIIHQEIFEGYVFRKYPRVKAYFQALVLGALQLRFARVLLEGLAGAPEIGRVQRWRQGLSPRPPKAKPASFLFAHEEWPVGPVLPIAAHNFLQVVPKALVLEATVWAPPVCSQPTPDGKMAVLGNGLVAYMAKRVCPETSIAIRLLNVRTQPRLSHFQLAWLAADYLPGWLEPEQATLIRCCRDVREAVFLSGRSKSHCAKLRKELGVLEW